MYFSMFELPNKSTRNIEKYSFCNQILGVDESQCLGEIVSFYLCNKIIVKIENVSIRQIFHAC